MSQELYIEEAPFGTRTLLVSDGRPVRVVHHFKRRNKAEIAELYWAKIGRKDNRLGAHICDLGDGEEGVLPLRERNFVEGEVILVGVRREATGTKRCVLTDRPSVRLPAATLTPSGDLKPGPLGVVRPPKDLPDLLVPPRQPMRAESVPPAVRHIALLATSKLDAVHCNLGAVAADIRRYLPDHLSIETDSLIGQAIEDAEDIGLERAVPLDGGGRLVIDEAEALTAIDLDVGTRQGQSGKGAAAHLFRDALRTLKETLSLRAIGGQVVVDLPRGAVRAPKMIRDQLTALMKSDGLTGVPAVTKDGLVVLVFGQNRASLLETLTEDTEDETFLRPARQFRTDVWAWRAFTAAAKVLRDEPVGQHTLHLAPDVLTLWNDSSATEALTDVFGARLTVRAETEEG
ncbi:MAG: ribonuclease E/G [Pseudomonadota bacterium]